MDESAIEADLRREPLFDPASGAVIASPGGRGAGHWAGAPGAVVADERVHLCYRLRAPAPSRGHTLVIARSGDGVRFAPVWEASRDDLDALSIERCAIVRTASAWALLVSFVAKADRRWRIEAIEADAVERLDPRSRRPVLVADAIGVAAVKDPWVVNVRDTWHLFASFGPLPSTDGDDLDATGDALSTGRTGSLTGLATSDDLVVWAWRGAVLGPSEGRWDAYTSRLTTAVPHGGGWIGFYDGSTLEGNYEERSGLAFSGDLMHWRKASVNGPVVGSERGAGGVRYLEVVTMPDGSRRAFYEWTRRDGSHELRTALCRGLEVGAITAV